MSDRWPIVGGYSADRLGCRSMSLPIRNMTRPLARGVDVRHTQKRIDIVCQWLSRRASRPVPQHPWAPAGTSARPWRLVDEHGGHLRRCPRSAEYQSVNDAGGDAMRRQKLLEAPHDTLPEGHHLQSRPVQPSCPPLAVVVDALALLAALPT